MIYKNSFYIVRNRRFNVPYFHVPEQKDECSICLSDLNSNVIELYSCGHKYHEECIKKSLERSRLCPLCRRNIDEDYSNCCICS